MIENFIPETEIYLQLLRFFLVLVLGVSITKAVLMPSSSYLVRKRGGDVKAAYSIENIVGILGIFTSLTLALQAAAFGNLVTVLAAVAAAATVAVGFGMRDQVASVVAGVFIHLDNPFVKGDYISVNDTEGVVKNISLRATALNGKDREKQIVPNNMLTSNVVKNFTKGRKTKVPLETIVSADKAGKASELMMNSLNENDKVMEKPKPEIVFKKTEKDETTLEASFWIKDSAKVKDIRGNILEDYVSEMKQEGMFEKETEEE